MRREEWPGDCRTIGSWVREHRDSLPRTLAELSRFPMAWRRAIVPALPFDDRVALWREHLATFLEPAGGLADDQRRFVADIIDDLEVLLASPPEAVSRKLDASAIEVLGAPLARRVLAQIGEEDEPEA